MVKYTSEKVTIVKLIAEYPVNENDYHTEDSLCKIGLPKAKGLRCISAAFRLANFPAKPQSGPVPRNKTISHILFFHFVFRNGWTSLALWGHQVTR